VHLLGTFQFGAVFFIAYLIIGAGSIAAALVLAYFVSKLCWTRGYNPDNFVLGIISALMDVIVTCLMVFVFKISV